MALTLDSLVVTPPTPATATGGVLFYVRGYGARPLTFTGTGFTAVDRTSGSSTMPDIVDGRNEFYQTGFAPGDYEGTVGDSSTPPLTLTVRFTVPALPTVDATPGPVAAAHLPMPLVLRATSAGGVPAALLLVVEAFRNGAWQPVGRLRGVCDALNVARFDLSEFVKTQFTPTPPDESGDPDPALAVRYRVRYGRQPDFAGEPGTEAGTVEGLAVNAAEVVNPGGDPLPFALGPALPYGSVPPLFAHFRSTLTSAGVRNLPALPVAGADWPCAVRQFVWLHPSGAWAWGFFSGRHEHGTETGDGTIVRLAGGVERYARRGDVRRTLRVHSDKVDRAAFDVLVSVRDSTQVYERLPTGQYVPVLVEPGSFSDFQETDKLFTVDFLCRYPVLVRQTQ